MQALPIGPCKYNFDLTLNGSGVTKLPSIRILGVELDSMLHFVEHISSQLKHMLPILGTSFEFFLLSTPDKCT